MTSSALSIEVRPDDLSSPEVQSLVSEHLADMHGKSPPGYAHALATDTLRAPDITFWTAWIDGDLCGCGALKELDPTTGEIKSMRTRSAFLRRGVGQAVLDRIVQTARQRGYTRLLLETGTGPAFEPAHAFYLRNGFTWSTPFGQYAATDFNVFMARPLSRQPHPRRSSATTTETMEPVAGSQNLILDAIGNTPLVQLRHVVPSGSARVVAKLESANPTGSMKDRMARAIVERAAADGRLPPGGTVIEYTAGTTGISLAFVCAALGYRSHFVFSDAFSDEKRYTMRAYGAEITDVASDNKQINEQLIKAMIATAAEMSDRPGHWWADQLNNHDGETGYHSLGEEIWRQSGGSVEVFVQAVSTAHSIHGTANGLRRHNANVRVVAVEPAESAVLSGGRSGSHKIEGIGIGFIPPLWKPDEVDEIMTVTTQDAKTMARRLAREESIFAGTSSGANVVAALRVAERLGPDATVATIIVDSGLRYLSTDLFRGVPEASP
jgi:cysteine synthase A